MMKLMPTFFAFIFLIALFGQSKMIFAATPLSNTDKISIVNEYERRGEDLYKKGFYDEALKEFEKAASPKYLLYSYSLPDFYHIQRVYRTTGNYEKALDIANFYLSKRQSDVDIENKKMFEALIAFRDSHNSHPVEDFIESIKAKYVKSLPPIGYEFSSPLRIATILGLYDIIRSYDAGIVYIEECISYLYKKHPEVKPVQTAAEAAALAEYKGPGKTDPNWRGYKIIRDYLLVREAFEQDKKEGTKGRATKELIKSDYFSW